MPSHSWRKVLYVDQGVPDNYVPPSFLTEMKKNLYLREYSYWGLVLASGRVAQQIGCVAAFVAVYALLVRGAIGPLILCAAPATLTAILGAAAAAATLRRSPSPGAAAAASASTKDAAAAAGTAAVFALATFVLSPILMTLTSSISTDTVYAMAAVMLLIHLVSRDYDDGAALASDSTSFNAGVFASVCLASRLPSAVHAFGLVLLAVQMLAVWPQAARQVRRQRHGTSARSPSLGWAADVLVTACVASLAELALILVAPAAAVVLLAAVFVFVTFVCPMWLLHLQPYKDNIYGPWDEATILE